MGRNPTPPKSEKRDPIDKRLDELVQEVNRLNEKIKELEADSQNKSLWEGHDVPC